MIVSPDVPFEHSFVPAELEGTSRIRLDSAIAQQHGAGGQTPDVGRNVCGEQQRVTLPLQRPGSLEQDARRGRVEACRRFVEQIEVDRRQKRVTITAAGRRLVGRVERARTREMTEAVAGMSTEVVRQFSRVLVKVIAELSSLPKDVS